MYKNFTYYNAGDNQFHRYGWKAQEKIAAHLEPNDNGYYTIPADGGKYYTFGTSEGKYGEFAKYGNTFFSVNSRGQIWAKVGTEKAKVFVEMLNRMISDMQNVRRTSDDEETEEDE